MQWVSTGDGEGQEKKTNQTLTNKFQLNCMYVFVSKNICFPSRNIIHGIINEQTVRQIVYWSYRISYIYELGMGDLVLHTPRFRNKLI